MVVYRIAKERYIRDLSGTGSRIYGGRWNNKGIGMVYTSEARSLSIVEFLVHVPLAMIPEDLYMASIKIPDDILPGEFNISNLPGNWRDYPAPGELTDLGSAWAQSRENLLLRVPSVVVPQEFNILINPAHPDINRVSLVQMEPLAIDSRLLQ